MINMNKRRLLQGAGSGLLMAGVGVNVARAARMITSSATSGPFYPVDIPLDSNADLVQVEGQDREASGEPTHLVGSVYDQSGNPIKGLAVEIWQCDAFGYYHHPRDRGGKAERQFQGFGKTITGANGEYHFRTIKPVRYTGRTPHIHCLVRSADAVHLVSQLYDRNEPANEADFLFRRVPRHQVASVTTEFLNAQAVSPDLARSAKFAAHFDIVLGITVPIA